MMHIALERPDQPEVVRLIDEFDAYQQPLYPAESHRGIDIEAAQSPIPFPPLLFAAVSVEIHVD